MSNNLLGIWIEESKDETYKEHNVLEVNGNVAVCAGGTNIPLEKLKTFSRKEQLVADPYADQSLLNVPGLSIEKPKTPEPITNKESEFPINTPVKIETLVINEESLTDDAKFVQSAIKMSKGSTDIETSIQISIPVSLDKLVSVVKIMDIDNGVVSDMVIRHADIDVDTIMESIKNSISEEIRKMY